MHTNCTGPHSSEVNFGNSRTRRRRDDDDRMDGWMIRNLGVRVELQHDDRLTVVGYFLLAAKHII